MLSYSSAATAVEQSNEFADLMLCREEGFRCSVQPLKGMLPTEPAEAKPHDFAAVPIVSWSHRHAKEALYGVT